MKNMTQKQISVILVGAAVLASVAFYTGTKYATASPNPSLASGGMNRFGSSASGARRGMMGGGILVGDILNLDQQTLTLKLRDGGSRIVFLSNSTPVLKTASGTVADLQIGQPVSITGRTNSDGSVNADLIQVRTLGANPRPQN
jgi:hypothetical protein